MVVKRSIYRKALTVNRVFAVQYTYTDCELGLIKIIDPNGNMNVIIVFE